MLFLLLCLISAPSNRTTSAPEDFSQPFQILCQCRAMQCSISQGHTPRFQTTGCCWTWADWQAVLQAKGKQSKIPEESLGTSADLQLLGRLLSALLASVQYQASCMSELTVPGAPIISVGFLTQDCPQAGCRSLQQSPPDILWKTDEGTAKTKNFHMPLCPKWFSLKDYHSHGPKVMQSCCKPCSQWLSERYGHFCVKGKASPRCRHHSITGVLLPYLQRPCVCDFNIHGSQ